MESQLSRPHGISSIGKPMRDKSFKRSWRHNQGIINKCSYNIRIGISIGVKQKRGVKQEVGSRKRDEAGRGVKREEG